MPCFTTIPNGGIKMALLDDLAEFFWSIDSIGKYDDKDKFMEEAKPLIKELVLKIRGGGPL